MNFLSFVKLPVFLTPTASTIAGAAFFAWQWTRGKVKDKLDFGSGEIVRQTISFCTISLLATCGRWALYILFLIAFMAFDIWLGHGGQGGAILAILLKYFIAVSVAWKNFIYICKINGKKAFLHPINSLEAYFVRETANFLKARLDGSIVDKVIFKITLHDVDKEARKLVEKAFPRVLKTLWLTLAFYLLLIFIFGQLYEVILEAGTGLEFGGILEYYMWPFEYIFA